MKSSYHTPIVLLLAIGALVLTTPNLPAATRAKANNADNLDLASSWTNNLPPGTADVALFDGTITSPITVAPGTDLAWNQINFINPGGDVTITAGNRLTLSNNTPITFGAGAANLALNCEIVCGGAAFATLPAPPAGRVLTYGGAIQGRNATVTLGNNTGSLRLGSSLTTQIGSAVQVSSSGPKLGLGASSVGNPPLSGPLGTNLFTWNASSGTELFAYNGDQTLGNPLRIQASPLLFNSADDLTFSGVVDLNNGNRTLNVSGSGALRFTGTLSNAAGITKIGAGILELGGTNVAAWNSGLFIYGGTVRLLTNDVIPNGPSASKVWMTNVNAVLDLNGFGDTINGLAGPTGNGTWFGTVDNTAPGSTSVLAIGDAFTYTLAGRLQNSGPGSKPALLKIVTGGLILSNANTFSGGITNTKASQIFINSIGAAGTGPVVLAHTNAELSYSGGGSITWTNDIILEANTQPVINANDGSTVEVAGIISGPGQLWRWNTFGKVGSMILSGDNKFTGGFVLYGGPVTLGHPRALGRGQFNIGDATFSGGSQTIVPGINLSGANAITNAILVNRDFTVGGTNVIEFAGPMVWITNATQRSINVTNPAGAVISGPVSGYGFNKNGQGLLTFNGVCSHNGPSTVSSGPIAVGPSGVFTGATTFFVGGSGLLDVSAAANFAIAPMQALNGSGKVKGNVTVNGALNPGDLIFTLTCSNNVTLAVGSITTVRVSRSFPLAEKLVCYGTLTYGGSLVVSNLGAAFLPGDTLDLFGFTGNPGTFASLTLPTLDAGLSWNTGNLAVDGTITVVSTAPSRPQISNPMLLNVTNFVMTVTGGTANSQFRMLSQTNVAEPVANWEIFSTNTYDGSGNLSLTNLVNPAEPKRFFRIVQP